MLSARLIHFCMVFAVLFLINCTTRNDKPKDNLGEISFIVSGKEEAQPFFKKGLLLLHSFEYVDAAEEFQKARKSDTDFVMAYWGEAMTHNHSQIGRASCRERV